MFFDSWHNLLRIVCVGALAYAALILLLRLFGKRMLSKMNAFDLVVTVALGSTLSSVVVSQDVPLADGLTALILLLGLQFCLAWAATRSRRVSGVLKSEPRLLFFRGEFLREALQRENIEESGVLAHIRQHGLADLREVEAVVLESDGSMSVLPAGGAERSTLANVQNFPPGPTPRHDAPRS